MAIDRGPWNALVDDNGSNLTGSVWNKAAIKTVLLDPIDAAIVPGTWQTVPFNVANFWPGVLAAHVEYNKYILVSPKVMMWTLQIAGPPVPSPAVSYLPLKVPGGQTQLNCIFPVAQAYEGSSFIPSFLYGLAPDTIGVSRNTGGQWIINPLTIYFTALVGLA